MVDKASDVVVVGGGVIGCAIAYELTERGARVTVVERGAIGGEASWASAGIISLPSRMDMALERLEISRRGLSRYPGLVAELEERTGIAIDYRRNGELDIAVDADHAVATNERAVWQQSQGFRVERVDEAAARELEPSLPPALATVWFAPDAGALTVHALTRAFAAAAEQGGATILAETPVERVTHADSRVTGVQLRDRHLPAATVVLATGAWTAFLGESLNVDLPTKPIKGQVLAFRDAPLPPTRIITGHGGYVRPRVDGTIIVAATEEDVGFDKTITDEGTAWLTNLARTLCPTLLEGEVATAWAGLRPGTVGKEPLMGPVPGYEGLWVVAGHFRTGAKEAPGTAELIAGSIIGGRLDPLLEPFVPSGHDVGEGD